MDVVLLTGNAPVLATTYDHQSWARQAQTMGGRVVRDQTHQQQKHTPTVIDGDVSRRHHGDTASPHLPGDSQAVRLRVTPYTSKAGTRRFSAAHTTQSDARLCCSNELASSVVLGLVDLEAL